MKKLAANVVPLKRGKPLDLPDLSKVFASGVTEDALRLSEYALKAHIIERLKLFTPWKKRALAADVLVALTGCSRATAFRALAELRRNPPRTVDRGFTRETRRLTSDTASLTGDTKGALRPVSPVILGGAQAAGNEGADAARKGSSSGGSSIEETTEKRKRAARRPLPEWFPEVLARAGELETEGRLNEQDFVANLRRDGGATERQLKILDGLRERLLRPKRKGYSIFGGDVAAQRAFSEDYQRRVRDRGLG